MDCNENRKLLAESVQHPAAATDGSWQAALAHVVECDTCQAQLDALGAVVLAAEEGDREPFRAQLQAYVRANHASSLCVQSAASVARTAPRMSG